MNFVRETSTTPKAIRKFLRTYGGTNPYGHPNWRLLRAEDVWCRCYGNYRDWPPELKIAERGGLNFQMDPEQIREVNAYAGERKLNFGAAPPVNVGHYENKPIREVTEMREVRYYAGVEGWILERWFPAGSKMIGSRDAWERFVAKDGHTPFLGEYPSEGDWVSLYGPYDYMPSTDQLKLWISKYYQGQEELYSTNPEQRMIAVAHEYEEREQKAWAARRADYNLRMSDRWKTIARSGSLGMSRLRNEIAKNAGIKEHIGLL